MTAVVTSEVGGGVAPGRRGTRVQQTDVKRVPYWVPWDNQNEGGWRLVPADTTHDAVIITTTDDVDGTGRARKQTEQLYTAKGFVPERFASPEAIRKLVQRAITANVNRQAQMLPPEPWAIGVLNRHPQVAAELGETVAQEAKASKPEGPPVVAPDAAALEQAAQIEAAAAQLESTDADAK